MRKTPDPSLYHLLPPLLPPKSTFAHFADAARHPFQARAAEFSWANAWWCAEVSLLAYADAAPATATFTGSGGFARCEPFDVRPSTQAYVVETPQAVIVAFRGTQLPHPQLKLAGTIPHVLEDVMTDARLRLADWRGGGRVHRGFRDALDAVWPRVEAHLNRVAGARPVWFTGHSLGGALATLAAARFGRAQGLYTFGSPLVGDGDFAERFPLRARTWRFVNNSDIVARVPVFAGRGFLSFALERYRHVGHLRHIDRAGRSADVPPDRAARLLDTVLGRISALEAAIRDRKPGWWLSVAADEFTDHAPYLYAVHVWNNLADSLPKPRP